MMVIKGSLSARRRCIATLTAICFAALLIIGRAAKAQEEKPNGTGAILLTIFLKHDQSKTIDEIQAQLRKNGFYQSFPPPGSRSCHGM